LRNWSKIGIHHEKQHQELLLTDIKIYILGNNPLLPSNFFVFPQKEHIPDDITIQEWVKIAEGIYSIGS